MKPQPQLIGIDLETHQTTASVYTAMGEALGQEVVRHEARVPASGLAELPVSALVDSVFEAVRRVLAADHVDSQVIVAVAVSGDPHTLLPLSEEGQPLHNAILRQDKRAEKEARVLAAKFTHQEVFRTTGCSRMTERDLAPKIRWMAEHASKVYARTHRFSLPQDYVIQRLGGEAVVEQSIAARSGLFDLEQGTWWTRMLTYLGGSSAQWPRVARAGEVVGSVDAAAAEKIGLPEGLPIVLGTTINLASSLGAGTVDAGQVMIAVGQSMVTLALIDDRVMDSKLRIDTCPHPVGLWCVVPALALRGGLLAWYRSNFAPQSSYAELDRLAEESQPGADGLTAAPARHQPGGAESPCLLAGNFAEYDKHHVVRALLEGEACALREHTDLLTALKIPIQEVRAVGGAANSPLMMQILANVLGVSVTRSQTTDATRLGTAMCAAVGAGLYDDLRKASQVMYGMQSVHAPQEELRARYESVYQRYRALVERNTPTA